MRILDLFHAIFLLIFFLFGVTGIALLSTPNHLNQINQPVESRTHIIGIMEFPMAVPDQTDKNDIPIQYIVRYVLDGHLEEIAVYSRTEAEALIKHLSEIKNEKD